MNSHPNIDPIALEAHLRKIEQNLSGVPIEYILRAKQQQEIDIHNAQVEAKKAAKGAAKKKRAVNAMNMATAHRIITQMREVNPANVEYATYGSVQVLDTDY